MRRAITFFELLIVVAVTVILAWILVPVFAETKAESHNGQDMRNMRAVSTALMLYTDDHDDRYVPVGAPTMNYAWSPAKDGRVDASGRPWNGWGLKLMPYVKSPSVFKAQTSNATGEFTGTCSHANGMELTNTYSMNWFLGRDGSYRSPSESGYDVSPSGVVLNRPITADSVHRLANTIAFQVSSFINPDSQDRACLRTTLKASDFSNRIVIPSAMDGGGNLAFTDGHTRWYEAREADPQKSLGPIYHWASRGIWMQPTMPEGTMGYLNSNGVR